MTNIIWKPFKLGDLFIFDDKDAVKKAQKNMNISKIQNEDQNVALVSAGGRNNGVVGYIGKEDYINVIPSKNCFTITFNSLTPNGAGVCLYHNYSYVTQTAKTFNFNSLKAQNFSTITNIFIAKMITKIFLKSQFFGYIYKINDDAFNREVILLPCIETNKENSIWEDRYTLAVEYIESLMERAKERREENTIKKYEAERKKYEAERKKYEAERKKYEAEYLIEKNKVVWKCNRIGDLFNFDATNSIHTPIKHLNISNTKTEEYPIALISQSSRLNGVNGYISKIDNTQYFTSGLTYADIFGLCFYHDYNFYLMHSHVNRVVALNSNLNTLLNNNYILNKYLAKIITKICKNGIYSYNWLPNIPRAKREYIELPYIECNKEDSIWEEDNRYYTLAVNYIKQLMISVKYRKYEFLCNSLYNKRCEA